MTFEKRPTAEYNNNSAVGAPGPSARKGPSFSGVTISNPDKELWPADPPFAAVTKLALAQYYWRAAAKLLPHIAGRPLSIVRAPDGIDGQKFFQRHASAGTGHALRLVPVAGEKKPLVAIDDEAGLMALAQSAVLEIHPWGSKPNEPDVPARLVFDLDPAPEIEFAKVIEAAKDVRARLAALGFVPFVKTTGGKGLHVVVAIKGTRARPVTWPDAKQFAREVCESLQRSEPARYTTTMSKRVRTGKIFLDYLRNDRMATAVAPWSPRARPHAPIAVPIPWSALKKGLDPAQFTIPRAASLLRKPDPWRSIDDTALALNDAWAILKRM